jgi:hypothetical protein
MQNYYMQATAYAIMFEELYKKPINQLVIIVAVEDDRPQVVFEERDRWAGPLLSLRREFEHKYGV